MPIYEYRCQACRRRVNIFFRSFSAVSEPECPRCGSRDLTRLVSRVVMRRGGGASGGAEEDLGNAGAGDELGGLFDGLDENDPRAMAHALRRMSEESGEPIEPEMEEALGRLEKGEAPDAVMADLDETLTDASDSDADDEF